MLSSDAFALGVGSLEPGADSPFWTPLDGPPVTRADLTPFGPQASPGQVSVAGLSDPGTVSSDAGLGGAGFLTGAPGPAGEDGVGAFVRTSIATATSIGTTGSFTNQDVNGLLFGTAWGPAPGALNLSYSFPTAASNYGTAASYGEPAPFTGFQVLSAAQQGVVRYALGLIAQYTPLTFSEMPETDDSHAVLRLAGSSVPMTSYSYDPANDARAGDSFFGNTRNTVPTKGGYAFVTFLHEIGHDLGLKHGQEADPTYGVLPDSHNSSEWSLMDYNSFVGATDGKYSNAAGSGQQTYMIDDIAAFQYLYGANYDTNAGDTRYTWNPATGEMFINGVGQGAASTNTIYQTIWDGGGNNTYDLSNYTTNLNIDLRPGEWSTFSTAQLADLDVTHPGQHLAHGNVANADLYNGDTRSLINNAVGGLGNDVIRANDAGDMLSGGYGDDTLIGGAGNDVLIGGPGADTLTGGGGNNVFRDTRSDMIGDTITDFHAGDTINITDVSGTGFAYTRIGTALNLGGAAVNLANNPVGHLIIGGDPTSGIDLTLGAHVADLQDFNGDGHSDLLWRNVSSGLFTEWTVAGTPLGNQEKANTFLSGVFNNEWVYQGSLDFNGDGVSDMAWRDTKTGQFVIWDSTGPGFTSNNYVDNGIGTGWTLTGLGDFNGDGRDDLLWRNVDGTLAEWQSTGTGFKANVFVTTGVDPSWHVIGIGDFNGDGRADVLFRNDNGTVSEWQSTGDGFAANVYLDTGIGKDWHLAATADFNGDGKSDLLWRNDNGTFVEWQSNGNGFTANVYVDAGVNNSWHVIGTGDYNDDGRADILWRNNNGTVAVWQSNGDGFNANTLIDTSVGNAWTLATHHYDFV